MLVFNFIFDLVRTGRGSSVGSVTLLVFRELKQIKKHGSRCKHLEIYVLFYVLLTVHLSIILVTDQHNTQIPVL